MLVCYLELDFLCDTLEGHTTDNVGCQLWGQPAVAAKEAILLLDVTNCNEGYHLVHQTCDM